MSMTMLTILQTSIVFVLYMMVTCGLPFILLNKRMKGFRLSARVMFSYLFGNFYVVNLVFILQLMHISNGVTLLIGTLMPFFVALAKLEGWPVKEKIKEYFYVVKKVAEKELGLKTLILNVLRWIFARVFVFMGRCFGVLKRHPVEIPLFLGLCVLAWYMYGQNLLEHFGYCASDIPVHNYWINYMSRDQLFVAGVYPFGFHCIVYYLHAVFGIETYVMLRVFCFIQTLIIHWALLFFLKACLQTRYVPYLGVAVYMGSNFFQANTYSRFNSSLPQEFGMIFILPAIYFGFAYFKYKQEELKAEKEAKSILEETEEQLTEQVAVKERKLFKRKKNKKEKNKQKIENKKSLWCLIGFAMSFSLTLAVHFYGTMIAGIFCVAMAIGYAFRFLRKNYFLSVVVTCFISVMSAVLPMAIAFALGTPLQGSLGWGMNILTGADQAEEVEETESTIVTTSPATNGQDSMSDKEGLDRGLSEEDIVEERVGGGTDLTDSIVQEEDQGTVEKIKEIPGIFKSAVNEYVSNHNDKYFLFSVFGSMALLVLLSLVFFVLRQTDYAAALMSVAIFLLFMCVLASSGALGLPRLMDGNRAGIYFSYCVPVLWCFALDAVLVLFFGWLKWKFVMNGASFLVLAVVSALIFTNGYIKKPYNANAMQTNDAITCLTNILHEHEDWTWTICSANDELRMGEDYGYHYETITFLREIESISTYADVTIPTKYIYFFVEKIPLDYAVAYENSGQSISEEGAKRSLPVASGIGPYQGENRWIVMSRMYYWAEAFMEMYPSEMTVYYESDDFICYRLEQNIDRLFELGIDYGYNNFVSPIQ